MGCSTCIDGKTIILMCFVMLRVFYDDGDDHDDDYAGKVKLISLTSVQTDSPA